MTLIPIEELRAPSQKTSLLSEVTQIIIYSRPSPCLADVGLFVRPKSQQIEGLGAPFQKTSLLGGVAQILIYPKSSPCLADVGLFVRPKSQQLGCGYFKFFFEIC